jgi:hypothetical protein
MPVELSVVDKPLEDVQLVIKDKNTKKVSLALRKTLDNHIIIQDHHNMNIVVMPDKGKILAFPKGEYTQDCYTDQDQLFHFLRQAGVIKPDSINGSTIYGSLEAMYNTEKSGDEEPVEIVILNISNFLSKDKEEYSTRKKFIDDLENQLLHPEDEESTDYGEISQEKFKGSIPVYGFPSRSVYRYNY